MFRAASPQLPSPDPLLHAADDPTRLPDTRLTLGDGIELQVPIFSTGVDDDPEGDHPFGEARQR